jgi:hypothetical protein
VCVWLHWSGGAIEAVQPPHMLVALVSLIWSAAVRGCHMSYLTTFWHVKAKLRMRHSTELSRLSKRYCSWEIKPQHTMTILTVERQWCEVARKISSGIRASLLFSLSLSATMQIAFSLSRFFAFLCGALSRL